MTRRALFATLFGATGLVAKPRSRKYELYRIYACWTDENGLQSVQLFLSEFTREDAQKLLNGLRTHKIKRSVPDNAKFGLAKTSYNAHYFKLVASPAIEFYPYSEFNVVPRKALVNKNG